MNQSLNLVTIQTNKSLALNHNYSFTVSSPSNETFILNDFYLICTLRFHIFELVPGCKLMIKANLLNSGPPNDDCFNKQGVTWCGGGFVSVLWTIFKCHQIPCDEFSSFDILIFNWASSIQLYLSIVPQNSPLFLTCCWMVIAPWSL